MKRLMLFTDGSVDAKTKIGFGAYFAEADLEYSLEELNSRMKVKRFENTSSTKLELETLLWAVNDILLLSSSEKIHLSIHTDSQNIVGLPARRATLEQQNFYSRNGKRLHNAELYQEFYRLMNHCDCQIIKVTGHKPQATKDATDKLFSLVDKASRSALREFTINSFPAKPSQNRAD